MTTSSTMRFIRPVLFFLVGLVGLVQCMDFTINAGNRTCYNPDGQAMIPQDTLNQWVVCNPSDQISTCCKVADYCMSNGLCFDAGSHNAMSIQGCTDPAWQGSCRRYCTSKDPRQTGSFWSIVYRSWRLDADVYWRSCRYNMALQPRLQSLGLPRRLRQ